MSLFNLSRALPCLALAFSLSLQAATPKPKNVAPAINLSGIPANYEESSPPIPIDPYASVIDPDSLDFDTGQLKVEFSRNGQDNDLLSIQTGGSLSLSGTTKVLWDGRSIATLAGGKGRTALTLKFTAAASRPIVENVLANITFICQSQNPSTLTRTIRFTLTDGDGGTSPSVEKLLAVTPHNDPPYVALAAPLLHYKENAIPLALDASANLTDDSSSFAGGHLAIQITGFGDDRLAPVANRTKQISVNGQSVVYAGQTIAAFSGGTDIDPLIIDFFGNCTPDAAKALLQCVSFWNTSDNPITAPRGFRVVAQDPDGLESAPVFRSIDVIAVNDLPVLSLSSQSLSYSEGDLPLVLDPEATVTDLDLVDFDHGKLTVTIAANAQNEDRLVLWDPDRIDLLGSSVFLRGIPVASLSGGNGKTALTINFNSQASAESVQDILRAIAYSNISQNPVTKTRTLNFLLTDGDGGSSAALSKSIQVASVVDPPELSIPADPISYEVHTAVSIADPATVSDADTTNFTSGSLTVQWIAGGDATDRVFVQNQGTRTTQVNLSGANISYGKILIGTVSGGNNAQPLTVAFNSKATAPILQTLLGALRFISDSAQPGTRILSMTLNDGSGGVSSPAIRSILFPQPPPATPPATPPPSTPPITTAPPTPVVPPTTPVTPPVTTPTHPVVIVPPAPEPVQIPAPVMPLDPDGDFDGDGISNGQELEWGLDPRNSDSNNNGTADGWEDTDGDGRIVLDEIRFGTRPNQFDSPEAPIINSLTASPSKSTVTLNWDEPVGYPTQTKIYVDGVLVATVAPGIFTYTDAPKPFNVPHEYQIQTLFPNGASSLSLPSVHDPRIVLIFAPPIPTIHLWLDANHDGVMEASDSGPNGPLADKPLLLWVNNDSDFTSNPQDSGSYEGKSSLTDVENVIPSFGKFVQGISCARDLEDYARLWIAGIPDLADASWTVRLSWESDQGPVLQFNYATDHDAFGKRDGGDRYLRDLAAAQEQINTTDIIWSTASPRISLGRVGPGAPLRLPGSLFKGETQFFLFTAVTAGKGNLLLQLLHNGEVINTTSASIQTRDIRDLYERTAIVNVNDDPGSTLVSAPAKQNGVPVPRNDSKEIIVFVHGWNMSQWEYESYSATFFKRLWWQGFQGRFVSVRWETLSGDEFWLDPATAVSGRTYNMSEFRAYRSGRGVAEYLKSLRRRFPDSNISVCAHSMGNVVMAEALRLLITENQKPIDNYVLMQAAFPAYSYDGGTPTEPALINAETNRPTPDTYRNYAATIGQAVSRRIVNFFNPNDFALQTGTVLLGTIDSNWIANERDVKPDNISANFDYTHIRKSVTQRNYYTDSTGNWEWIIPLGLGAGYSFTPQLPYRRDVTNPHEILAFIARPRSRTVGAQPGVGGPIQSEVNLASATVMGLARGRNEHGGQFNWNIQKTGGFYLRLLDTFGMGHHD